MKTITSVELAKLAGVSQSTVSRCLNDSPLVSDETKAQGEKDRRGIFLSVQH